MKRQTPLSAFLFTVSVLSILSVSCKKEQIEETPEPEADYFSVEFTELTQGSISVSIVPKDNEQTYYFGLIEESDYDSEYNSDPQTLVDSNLQYFSKVAISENITLEQLLAEALLSGDRTWTYEALTPATKYLFYVYHLSTEGEELSPVTFAEVQTPAVKMLDTKFTITAEDQTHTSFSLRIVPDDDQVYYYYDVFTLGQLNDYCGGSTDNIKDFLPEYFSLLKSESYADYTVPQFVYAITVRGEYKDDYSFTNLLPETEYYAFAVAVGNDMTLCSPVSVQKVSTTQSPKNEYSISFEEVTDISYSASVSVTESEAYAVMCELKEYFTDDMTDSQIISELYAANNSDITAYVTSGDSKVSFSRLIPSQDYYLFVFACNSDGTPKTDSSVNLLKHEFHTYDAQPINTQFYLSVSSITKTTAQFNVDSDNYDGDDTYMFNYIKKSDYDAFAGERGDGSDGQTDEAAEELIENGLKAHMNAFWQDKLDAWKAQNPSYADAMTMKEFMSRYLLDEASMFTSYDIEGLEPGTDYVAYLFGMKPDGTFTTGVFTDEFTTVAEESSLADMEILVMATNSSLSSSTTYYVWAYPGGSYDVFYAKYFTGTDEWAGKSKSDLLPLLQAEGANRWSRSFAFAAPWSSTWTFYTVVYDINGVPSAVYKVTHEVPAEGEGASIPTKQEEIDITVTEIN